MLADKEKAVVNEERLIDDESLKKLEEFQEKLLKVEDEFENKSTWLEIKCEELSKPIYKERNEIIESLPYFWRNVFLTHPAIRQNVSKVDFEILGYLTSISVVDTKDLNSGYSISFSFNPNPFFEAEMHTKYFKCLTEKPPKVTATPIKWKKEYVQGISDYGKKGNKRLRIERSFFFKWFKETHQGGESDDEEELMLEVADDILQAWNNPLKYLHGIIELYCEGYDGYTEAESDDGDDNDHGDGDDIKDEVFCGGDSILIEVSDGYTDDE